MIEVLLVGKTLKLIKVKDNQETNQMTKKERAEGFDRHNDEKFMRFCFVLFCFITKFYLFVFFNCCDYYYKSAVDQYGSFNANICRVG